MKNAGNVNNRVKREDSMNTSLFNFIENLNIVYTDNS